MKSEMRTMREECFGIISRVSDKLVSDIFSEIMEKSP